MYDNPACSRMIEALKPGFTKLFCEGRARANGWRAPEDAPQIEWTAGCLDAHCIAHKVAASSKAISTQASTLSVFLNIESAPANLIDLALDDVSLQRFQRQ
jgi:hypothetical protein